LIYTPHADTLRFVLLGADLMQSVPKQTRQKNRQSALQQVDKFQSRQ